MHSGLYILKLSSLSSVFFMKNAKVLVRGDKDWTGHSLELLQMLRPGAGSRGLLEIVVGEEAALVVVLRQW